MYFIINHNKKKKDYIKQKFILPTIAGIFTIALIFFQPSQAIAQWSTNSDSNNVIRTTTSYESYPPLMVSNDAGGAILTLQASVSLFAPQKGPQADIFAQQIDAGGSLPWGEDETAMANSRLDQVNPVIIKDGSGGAIIAWLERQYASVEYNLCAQRIDASKTQLWALGGEIIFSGLPEATLSLCSDGQGGAIIAYEFDGDILAAHIDATGVVQWDAQPVSTAQNDQYQTAMIADGNGGAIITWTDLRNGTDNDIYAQHIDASGTAQWTTNGVIISDAANDQTNPAIISDGNTGAIIAWSDFRSGTNWDIYVQHINASGTLQWNNATAIPASASEQVSASAIISDGNGGAITAWQDFRNNTDWDIYAQKINASGVTQWDSAGVAVCTGTNNQSAAAVVSDGVGGAVVTWQDARKAMDNTDIYAQRIDNEGVVQWTTNGVAVSTAAGNQSTPIIVSDGSNGAIIAWNDHRPPDPGILANYIYGQRVTANGQLGSDALNVTDKGPETPDMFKLNQNYPNPFNPQTTFSFQLPNASHVVLAIYNTLGRKVATVVDEVLPAGEYSRTFDAGRFGSGLYFYRLTAGKYSHTRRMVLLK